MILKTKPLRRDMVKGEILRMIGESGMKAGDRLPPEKKLGEIFGVTHVTVRAALAELEKGRVVERVAGSGTFFTGRLEDEGEDAVKARSVATLMRNDRHFFGDLHYEICLALQDAELRVDHRYLPPRQDPDEQSGLIRDFAADAESLIIDQTDIESDDRLFAAFRQCAPRFKRVVRLLGNGCRDEPSPGYGVAIDFVGAYHGIVERLKAKGHRRIAYFGGCAAPDFVQGSRNRKFVSLYAEAMIANDLARHIAVQTGSGRGLKSEIPLAEELLRAPELPTAVICTNDYRGVILVDRAREMGLRIPEDLSVVGFFDTPWSQHYGMDSMRPRGAAIAAEVIRALKAPAPMRGGVTIPADYVERQTVRTLAEGRNA